MTALVYLVGAPGSGKSTAMAAATRQLHATALTGQPSRILYTNPAGPVAVELGARRAGFAGTDALPLNALRSVERWLRQPAPEAPIVLGEGQRLGNHRFLQAAVNAGLAVTLIHLVVPANVAIERRQHRARTLGVPLQDEAWCRGATTTARRLAKNPPPGVQVVTLDGRRPSAAIAGAIWDLARMAERRSPQEDIMSATTITGGQ